MDASPRARHCGGWETIDDDSLEHIVYRTNFLTAVRLSACYTNYFKALVRKHVSDKVMLVGVPFILEEHVFGGSVLGSVDEDARRH
ncbi:hypothetical protein D1007_00544 [Hordeum vulgare]|nr:hypothetical protein D1007_00544 [Hordeum vulgare]